MHREFERIKIAFFVKKIIGTHGFYALHYRVKRSTVYVQTKHFAVRLI